MRRAGPVPLGSGCMGPHQKRQRPPGATGGRYQLRYNTSVGGVVRSTNLPSGPGGRTVRLQATAGRQCPQQDTGRAVSARRVRSARGLGFGSRRTDRRRARWRLGAARLCPEQRVDKSVVGPVGTGAGLTDGWAGWGTRAPTVMSLPGGKRSNRARIPVRPQASYGCR